MNTPSDWPQVAPEIDWIRTGPLGFYCVPGEFYIDPKGKCRRAIISHAHADHYPPGIEEVYATKPTLDLGKARYKATAGKKRYQLPLSKNIRIRNVIVRLTPAGHILGSTLIQLQYNGQTVLFSGDFDLQPNPTCKPLEYPDRSPDLLICESTHGQKDKHKAPEQAIRELSGIVKHQPVVIGTYVIGKAQQVNCLLTKAFPDQTVFIHKEIKKYHEVYQQHDFDPGEWQLFQKRLAKKSKHKFFLLVPPRVLSGYVSQHQCYKVKATGWQQQSQPWYLDGILEISNHAASIDLLHFISQIQPKKVAFWHGYPESLIQSCQNLNIPAYPVFLHEKQAR